MYDNACKQRCGRLESVESKKYVHLQLLPDKVLFLVGKLRTGIRILKYIEQ